MTLYHFTCVHGWRSIGRQGLLLPVRHVNAAAAAVLGSYRFLAWQADVIWLTDLPAAEPPEALGLRMVKSQCDRTAFRYRVEDEDDDGIVWWPVWAVMNVPAAGRELLEGEPGAAPDHWWVARFPLRAVYDPVTP